ncbi:MAG: 50S ribosomal protein L10 [Pleomorphochaeta sp.]
MEYKTRITPAKENAVKELKNEFEQYSGFIFTDYRGMTVEQITKLRKELLTNDGTFRVVKNRFAKLAMRDLGLDVADDVFVGPTAIALSKGDTANEVAKAVFKAKEDGAPMVVKCAKIDGQLFDSVQIEAFSKLPGRLELIASLMGTMKAPVQKLAATLLAYVEKNSDGATAVAEEN